ncbi:MAG: hypothetical protein ACYDFU_07935 [Nitrospirota bacterium]
MSKPLIWILIVIGLLLIILGVFSKVFIVIGFLTIAAALYFGLGPDGVLRKEQVSDTWAALIENAQGNGDQLLQDTEEFITASKAPDIRMEYKEIAPGFVSGMIGKKRKFLIIIEHTFRLKPYQIYMCARDYGNNLDVSWFLTYKPSLWQSIASLIPYVNIIPHNLSDLDLFDQQDLRAYTTNAHRCMQKAVDKLMLSLQQDPSKLERKSRGFLGIS